MIKIDILVYTFLLCYIMQLPDDVLPLIREFSRPMTHPRWRYLNKMPSMKFHWLILSIYNTKRIPVIERFVLQYDQLGYRYVVRSGFVVELVKN